jgi:hypothetical protein
VWIFTTFGFFSVTEVRNNYNPKSVKGRPQIPIQPPGTLQVRARVRGDLDNFKERYLPELSEIYEMPWRDYPYRAFVDKQSFAAAMVLVVHDLTYNNFKATVEQEMGHPRESLYASVWGVMYGAEGKLADKERKERARLAALNAQPTLGFGRSYREPWVEGWGGWDDRSDEELDVAAERSISLLGSEMDDVLFTDTDEIPLPEKPKGRRGRRRRKTEPVAKRKGIVKPPRKR